jgi:hypothetical protein
VLHSHLRHCQLLQAFLLQISSLLCSDPEVVIAGDALLLLLLLELTKLFDAELSAAEGGVALVSGGGNTGADDRVDSAPGGTLCLRSLQARPQY